MKTFITGLIFICFTSFVSTGKYPVMKLYAYQQKVSSGANFSSEAKRKAKLQHYVYLLVRSGRNITVDDVWIDGRSVSFKTEGVKSPVTMEKSLKLGNNADVETLVTETTHTVMQIVFTSDASTEKVISPSRYRNYPLLIKYSENGKTYFLGSKSWSELTEKVNQ